MSTYAAIKVVEIAGRGIGVLTTRSFKPGQVILQEMPFARVSKNAGSPEVRAHPVASKLMDRVVELAASGAFNPRTDNFHSWPSEVRRCMEGVLEAQAEMEYDRSPPAVQAKWRELSDVHAVAADDDASAEDADQTSSCKKTPGGVLRTNGVDDDEGYANLYEKLSRMNHSCEPNAVRIVSRTDPRAGPGVHVVASRHIDKGEEVFINYIDGADDGLRVEERRHHLQQQYHFHCTCSRCMREAREE